MRVAVAASSQIAADAGAHMAGLGGNAVDAVLATAMVSLCTDPGIVSPGGGSFIAIWPPRGDPVVIDGCVAMPGIGSERELGDAMWEEVFDYHGETRSCVGFGSVATPGDFASLAAASEQFGRLPWHELLQPAIYWADKGFPLLGGGAEYLRSAHEAIYGWHEESRRILHHPDGRPLAKGDLVHVPHLADSLRLIANEGASAMYDGEIGGRIADAVQEAGGLLGEADLAAYNAEFREPIMVEFGNWRVATNPAPSVGGPCLAAMLRLLEGCDSESPDETSLQLLVHVQDTVLNYRADRLDGAHDRLPEEIERMLLLYRDQEALLSSPSTIHVSGVDSEGWACSITSSDGYCSGAMAPRTGIWLNNSLGEVDLHTRGLTGLKAGSRLASNMAPTVARRADGAILAIGSPGASRITTALSQVLLNHVYYGMSLETAVTYPRLHVELSYERPAIAYEPDLAVPEMKGYARRPFPRRSMYFGGVQAARWSPASGLAAVGDDRRAGCVAYGM